jgi:hypothetical protein
MTIHSNFETEVLLEQAFHLNEGGGRQIVDIVIICYEKRNPPGQTLAQKTLLNNCKGTPKQIFLIENKINEWGANETQLSDQVNATIDTLTNIFTDLNRDEILRLISLIFVSPNRNALNNQFLEFENNPLHNAISKVHIYWDNNSTETESVVDFLKQILTEEAEGECESISDYTKSTIKSFITFIRNGFKSNIQEEIYGGNGNRRIYNNLEELIQNHTNRFNRNGWNFLLREVNNRLIEIYGNQILMEYSRGHPISIALNTADGIFWGHKIFSINSGVTTIQLIVRNHPWPIIEPIDLANHFRRLSYTVRIGAGGVCNVILDQFNSESILEIFALHYEIVTNGLPQ